MASTAMTEVNAPLRIHFGPHVTSEDARAFEPELNEANIFMPELAVCDDQTLKLLNRTASGSYKDSLKLKQKLETIEGNEFGSEIVDMLHMRPRSYGRLRVSVMDVPPTTLWKQRMIDIMRQERALAIFPSIEDSLEHLEARFRVTWDIQDRREHVIADNVSQFLRSPEVTEMPVTPRPLMVIGYLHDGLTAKLENRDIQVHKTDTSYQGPEHYHDTLTRALRSGGDPDRSLLLRTFIGCLVSGTRIDGIRHIDGNSTPLNLEVERKIVDSIPDDELESTVQSVIDMTIDKNGLEGASEATDGIMRDATGHTVLGDKEIAKVLK